jgi:polyhydroxyalkanoate synthase
VPWVSAYASTQVLRGPQRFVLGASGHIAGVVNPPAKKRRSYWAADKLEQSGHHLPGDPNTWFAQAVETPGSWWPDWAGWLSGHSGKQVKAREKLGNAKYRPIEPAPGRYVKVRAA